MDIHCLKIKSKNDNKLLGTFKLLEKFTFLAVILSPPILSNDANIFPNQI